MSLLHDEFHDSDDGKSRRRHEDSHPGDGSYARLIEEFEFPPEQYASLKRARRLAWWTIAYLLTVVILMYLVMGSSQAMKTAWLEDMLSLIPPFVFLFASYTAAWKPDRWYPYGYHRAVSVAFLVAATALFVMGGWLLIESIRKLVSGEHPSIGSVTVFGTTFWLGWLMLPVLLWSVVPVVFLGRAKLPLAETIHDKVLHTDAMMNKADWMTGGAAMAGVVGIALGWWWADTVAAALISLDILHDGYSNLKEVVRRLMAGVPRTVDRHTVDPLPERVLDWLIKQNGIAQATVRLREEGHVYFGEAFIVPKTDDMSVMMLNDLGRRLHDLDWRLHDVVLVPVPSLKSLPRSDSTEPSSPANG